ncbi:membrane protein DedA with SNARE-associated domain [Sphingomonas jejuensis]|uniref:Membrane protein DedA with SNARE-associated domain n=1 Tax=Sphingomonas jejuensis TaxID=904715 RepID=A0ABX0XJ15_9SPHN|nr:VTT domain-containing protein [Sphingomonas jejuensis]NJC33326.1 membrane protein DedA with SNARE-associated domain [Sphingomonas jejuensis]
MDLEQLVARWGLLALLIGAGVEGETVVVLGGISVSRELLAPVPAVLAAATGSFIADQLFFAIGRRSRSAGIVVRAQRRAAFARILRTLERRPVAFIFAFRFLWGLRTISPIAIGTSAVPTRLFVMVNAAAALCWATLFVTLGAVFGEALGSAIGEFAPLEHSFAIGIAAILAIAATYWVVRRRRLRGRD